MFGIARVALRVVLELHSSTLRTVRPHGKTSAVVNAQDFGGSYNREPRQPQPGSPPNVPFAPVLLELDTIHWLHHILTLSL